MSRAVHTPEHVLIELTPAGLGARFLAFVIDFAIILGLIALAEQLRFLLPEAIAQAAIATLGFLFLWGYHIYFELRADGVTPGKRVARIRVVDGRGLPLSLPQSLARNLLRVIDLLPLGGVGMAFCLFEPHRRRLGDLVADTLVVSDRQPGELQLVFAQARRENSLRTPRLKRLVRRRISLEERELLLDLCLRAERLDGNARLSLFEELGGHYRVALEIDDERLSGESVIRGIVALAFSGEQ